MDWVALRVSLSLGLWTVALLLPAGVWAGHQPWLREMVGLGSIFDTTVMRTHPARGLAELDLGGHPLFAPLMDLTVGARARILIPARDVILAMHHPSGLSLHNVIPTTVRAVLPDPSSGQVIVQLEAGTTRLLAEVTADAIDRLDVREG